MSELTAIGVQSIQRSIYCFAAV